MKKTKTAKGKKTYKRKAYKKMVKAQPGVLVINKKPQALRASRTIIDFLTIVNPLVTSDVAGVPQVQFSQLPNFAEYQALFSTYNITKVKFHWRFVDLADTSSGLQFPFYVWKNNSTTITAGAINEAYVGQLQKVQCFMASDDKRTFTTTVKPYYLTRVFNGISDAYLHNDKSNGMIDILYPNVPHYTIGYLIPNLTGSAIGTYFRIACDCEIFFKVKGVQ